MASAVTLSILMLPYIIRTTELSIRRVPDSIREGAIALGSTKSSMINRLTLRFALPGIITGVMLAVSISFSETAPLLYTADFNNYLPTALFHQPVGFLTYIVYVYSNLPYQSAHNLAYAASFVLLSFVFVVNLFARVVLKRFSKI
jgi:phosphate transport system permease protein